MNILEILKVAVYDIKNLKNVKKILEEKNKHIANKIGKSLNRLQMLRRSS